MDSDLTVLSELLHQLDGVVGRSHLQTIHFVDYVHLLDTELVEAATGRDPVGEDAHHLAVLLPLREDAHRISARAPRS